jgi:hypothetical protein
MAIREFTDSIGRQWRVWTTLPSPSGVALTLQGGWLTFDTIGERRRLAPVPDGWSDASPRELERLCARGIQVRRTPMSGSDVVDADREAR